MESIRTWSAGRYRRFQEGSATESSRKHALEPAQLFPANTKEDVKRDVELVRFQSGTVRHLALRVRDHVQQAGPASLCGAVPRGLCTTTLIPRAYFALLKCAKD